MFRNKTDHAHRNMVSAQLWSISIVPRQLGGGIQSGANSGSIVSAMELNEALDVRGLTAGGWSRKAEHLGGADKALGHLCHAYKDRKPFKNDIGRSNLKNSNLKGLTDVANRT